MNYDDLILSYQALYERYVGSPSHSGSGQKDWKLGKYNDTELL